MNRVVQTSFDLRALATTLRARHDDNVCTCPCTGNCDGGKGRSEAVDPEMDMRERKWAAQKLLRPIEDNAVYEDLTIFDWLEVARQSWKLRMENSSPQQTTLERFQFASHQLEHTAAYARAVWGLSDKAGVVAAEGTCVVESDPTEVDSEDYDCDVSDLFDWDVSDIDVNYTSDPNNDAPHQVWRDEAGNKVKVY